MLGDMGVKITVVAFLMFTVLSLGLSSNSAFAGFSGPPEGVEMHYDFFCTGGIPPCVPDGQGTPTFFDFDGSGSGPSTNGFILTNAVNPGLGCSAGICTIIIPNFEDDLEFKDIAIFVKFFGDVLPDSPPVTAASITDILCSDSITGDVSGSVGFVGLDPEGSGELLIELFCQPNPDYEIITIDFGEPAATTIVQVWVETQSFDDQPIGGISIPIDQSALLLAGVQSVSMWMIPVVIAGVGIGVFVIKRRK